MNFDPRLLAVARRLRSERIVIFGLAYLAEKGLDAATIAEIAEMDPESVESLLPDVQEVVSPKTGSDGKNIKKSPPKRAASDKVAMERNWKLPLADAEYARRWGFADDEIRIEAIDFRDYWLQRGEKRNWSLTWQNRIRQSARRLGKPAPSDEPPAVTELPLAPAAPKNAAMLRDAMAAYSKSNFWPSSLGPEPGQPGCVVPKEIIAEFRGAA